MKPYSSRAERALVEDDETTPRDNTEVAGSRAAAGVATALKGVAVAKAEMNGGMKWRAVLQGGKPPRETLRDDESEPNYDPLLGDGSLRRLGIAPI